MSVPSPAAPLTLRYRPHEVAITLERPFENDKLGREPFVTAISDLLKSVREPLVIALNAPWGSGKSTTLRLLESKLSGTAMSSVCFNAWEVDDATDPLVPLVAALHERLQDLKGYGGVANNDRLERLKRLGSAIVKHGAVAAVKAGTAGLFDLGAATDGFAKAAKDAAVDLSEEATGDLIDAFKRERRAAQQFVAVLKELMTHTSPADGPIDQPPFVLMIDELDRCRPTFAVAMLERIKHFFTVPGLVFFIALDLEQLKASTRKVYGADLDAAEYLRRFVDLELRLPQAKASAMVDSLLTSCGADSFFATRAAHSQLRSDRSQLVQTLSAIADSFELSPRVVQRMISRLILVVRQTPENQYLDPVLMIFMIFLRVRNEGLLRDFVAGRVNAFTVMQTMQSVQPGGKDFYYSRTAELIEAYLLYADNQRDYVQTFLTYAKQLESNPTDDREITRSVSVSRAYEWISSNFLSRGGINLKRIDLLINLVTSDAKDF